MALRPTAPGSASVEHKPKPTECDATPSSSDLVRPHSGSRPGGIDIDLPTGVHLMVDSYVNEKALARVLRALGHVS